MSTPEPVDHRRRDAVLILLIWAMVGVFILNVKEPDEQLDVVARVILIWPVFLFVTPPGWALLALLLRKSAKDKAPLPSSTPLFSQPESPPLPTFPELIETQNETAPESDSHHEVNALGSEIENPQQAEFKKLDPDEIWPTAMYSYELDEQIQSEDDFDSVPPQMVTPAFTAQPSTSWIVARNIAIQSNWKCPQCLLSLPNDLTLFGSNAKHRFILVHKIPISLGGTNDETNLKAVHFSCSSYMEWEKLRLKPPAVIPQPQLRDSWSPPANRTSTTFKPNYSSNRRKSQPKSRSQRRDSDPRLGEWGKPDPIINSLLKRIDRAKISEEQRERALEFLESHHELDLMKKCQRGHTLSLENTYFRIEESGRIGRQCRECRR